MEHYRPPHRDIGRAARPRWGGDDLPLEIARGL